MPNADNDAPTGNSRIGNDPSNADIKVTAQVATLQLTKQ